MSPLQSCASPSINKCISGGNPSSAAVGFLARVHRLRPPPCSPSTTYGLNSPSIPPPPLRAPPLLNFPPEDERLQRNSALPAGARAAFQKGIFNVLTNLD
ncbi:Hypothetical protein NTJ_09066 [Nesidiocoris tenuis]|uniref:Uncharacterized protein n=1 Tax=Nesidiocoris tenuis TaxID=355587 RepID=A0ABN7AY15_9HEMI|nr:Hypothetical protein NTJ_09066 [Nesidiocoris tenuis]